MHLPVPKLSSQDPPATVKSSSSLISSICDPLLFRSTAQTSDQHPSAISVLFTSTNP